MGTFLISTYGTNGDVLPFVRIGQSLHRRGHEVVLHTHEFYGATARAAGLDFVPVDTEEAYAQTLHDAQHLLLNVLSDVNHLADYYQRNGLWEQIRREYESMARVVRDRDPASVVAVSRHTSGLSVLMLREAYGVPAAWVALSPTLFMAVPLTERIFPRTLAGPANRVREQVGLPPVTDWAPWLSSADLQIGLWPGWFDEVGDAAPAGAALPGFVLHDDAETGELPPEVAALVADGVPDERRPVLVTGGSGQLLHREWYRVAAEACARVGRPGILVCRHRELLPEALPEGVLWQPALPFRSLIPRVAAVVHHGGVLTCARVIASGVPQVILAHGTDRPDNAARLRKLGLAEWLPAARWSAEATATMLAKVLNDPAYRNRNREYAPRVDSAAAVDAATDHLEGLLGQTSVIEASPKSLSLLGGRPDHSGTAGVRERLARLTPEQRALLARRLRKETGPAPRPPRLAGEEVFDCSVNQRRAWLAAQVDPDGAGNHVATAIRLRGPLDVAALADAVDQVVARHDGLRAVPVPGGEEPRQRVVGALRAPLRVLDGPADLAALRAEPFDLARGPLVRAVLVRTGPEEHVFLLAGHHFVMDAASLGIVVAEVAAAYGGEPAPADPVQYPDVAVRQRRRLAEGGLERALAYWRSTLDGVGPPVDLPLPPGPPGAAGTAEAVHRLAPDLVDRLTAGTGRLGLGPVLLTAYQLLLGRYTGGAGVPVGLFVGGRTEPGTERVVGDFTNIVVARADLSGEPPFTAAVRRVGEAVAGALAHQDAPFEAVVAALAPPRRPGRPPLVQFGFNLQDYRLHETKWAGLTATVLPVQAGHSDLDLTLVVLPTDAGDVKLVLEYPAGRFAADAVDTLATQLHDLLRLLATAPERPVAEAVLACLPEPAAPAPAPAAVAPVAYEAPRTEGEELVAGVFAEVLDIARIGVHHDFFGAGGHSLHALRVIGRINAATGLDVPVRALFTHPTVAGLTAALEEMVEAAEAAP